MFSCFLLNNGFLKIFINTLLISIPEVFFWIMFTLTLVGEFEYWREPECKRIINRFDYVRVFLPTIVVAFLANVFEYIGLNKYLSQIISIAVFYILVVLTNDVFGDASALKWMAKAFIFMLLGFLIIHISQLAFINFALYFSNVTIKEIECNIVLNFMILLPIRILQYSLLLYFVIKKRTLLQGHWLKLILSSNLLTVLLIIIVTFNILFSLILYKALISYKILSNTNLDVESGSSILFLFIGIILFSMINILGFLTGCYYLKDKEMKDRLSEAEKLYNLSENIRMYINKGNYDNIMWKLNGVSIEVENIADSIYQENKMDKQ